MATNSKTSREIAERYVAEDRNVTQERSDFLLPQIIDFVTDKKWMNLQPEYQRRQVWDNKKQSLFIESLLMNLPVPPIFLFESDYNRYEVMDGQQRLTSIVRFYSNKYKLAGLEYWGELNNKFYSDLPPILQRGLDRRRISAVVLQSSPHDNSKDELRRVVFERLNTGGQKLNAQELRNCIYAGPFADLIVELAGYRKFNEMWDIPPYEDNISDGHVNSELGENPTYKRMVDCELVLRFFAFRARGFIKGSVKSILDKCMGRFQGCGESEIDVLRDHFKSRIDLAYELFGPNAFKLVEEGGKPKPSQTFYDCIMVACDRQYAHAGRLIERTDILIATIGAALDSDENHAVIVGRANTAEAIKKRLALIEECFVKAL